MTSDISSSFKAGFGKMTQLSSGLFCSFDAGPCTELVK